ncbi:MAG TPA: HAMP domain-containing protein, partial [Acidimicrobiales bacterium]|nr:HAMP domain-containing protein [Acidimicrobiales bacterium]
MAAEALSSSGSAGFSTARAASRRVPRATIRTRLTLVYGGLFLLSGAAVVVVTDELWRSRTSSGPTSPASAAEHASDLHTLLVSSAVVLGVMAVVSLLLGWLVAGRLLRPLRTITRTARAITATSLHERLSLAGPNDELRALGDSFDDLLGRLEDSFDAQRSFVANAAHELRTPHATMRVWLDVALAKPIPVPDHIAALGERLSTELDYVGRLLDGLLVLARADRGAV